MQTSEIQSRIDLHLVPKLQGAKGIEVLELWREAAHGKLDGAVEIAAQFQRPAPGRLKLPQNICLVLSSDEVVAFKFNPRNTKHPLDVRRKQLGQELDRWPRENVSIAGVQPSGMTSKVTFRFDGEEHEMRCPPLSKNPAALGVIVALGGSIGAGV
jgi:hypothetical protein